MFNKLKQGLRSLGEKTSTAASWLGHKVGGAMITISPVVSLFNPVIGSGVASAGLVMKNIGALGDAGKAMLTRGEFHPQEIRRTINGIRNDAGAVLSAYATVRGAGNPLERGRIFFLMSIISNNHHVPQELPRVQPQT